MKRLLSLLALAVVTAAFAFGAYTKQAARVQRIQMELVLDAAGTVTAVRVDGFIQVKRLVNDADAADVVEASWRQVSFDLLTIGDTTAATKTNNGQQTAAIIRKMVLDQATAQGVQ